MTVFKTKNKYYFLAGDDIMETDMDGTYCKAVAHDVRKDLHQNNRVFLFLRDNGIEILSRIEIY